MFYTSHTNSETNLLFHEFDKTNALISCYSVEYIIDVLWINIMLCSHLTHFVSYKNTAVVVNPFN